MRRQTARRLSASWTVTTSASPERAFAYLVDVRRHHEWSPKPYRVEGVDEGTVHVGSRFTSYGWIPRDAEHRNEVEVVELEQPTLFTLESRDGDERYLNRFVVTPEGDDGSRIERTMDLPMPSGPGGVLFRGVVAVVLKPGVSRGMSMLADVLDQGRDRADGAR